MVRSTQIASTEAGAPDDAAFTLDLRDLVGRSVVGVYAMNIDPHTGESVMMFTAGSNGTGYTAEELTSDPLLWKRIIHPDDRARVEAADLETNRSGEPFSLEYRMIRKDGSVLWVLDEGRLVSAAGGPPRWVGVTLDITARKLAEAAVERSLEQLALIVDGALDAVVTMDADGAITGWNPQAERTFGWPRGEVLGRRMAEVIVPEELREAHEQGLRHFLETGEGPVIGRRIEVEAIDRFGRRFPVELSIVSMPMHDEVSFAGFVRDISERKEAEAEMRRALDLEREAADELRRASEMKDLFLQAVSHDLRTPLAAILGMSLTLQRSGNELSADARSELVDRLSANARKLERLVSNLLDVDRLRRGVVEPVLEPVDLAALIREVVEDSGLADRVTVEAEPIVAWVDGPKVERIIENSLPTLAATPRRTLGSGPASAATATVSSCGWTMMGPACPRTCAAGSSTLSNKATAFRSIRRGSGSGSRSSDGSPSCTAAAPGSRNVKAAAPRSGCGSPTPATRRLTTSEPPPTT
jgi:PAS domain S-box-containing protein